MTIDPIDSASIEFKHFVKSVNLYSSVYTKEFMKQFGNAWSVDMQLLHVVSEVGEVYETIRKGRPVEESLQEIVDVILSSFTLLDIALIHCERRGLDPKQKRDEAIDWVIDKITKRLKENHYAGEKTD